MPLPVDHVGEAHPACVEKQREIVNTPAAKRMAGATKALVSGPRVNRADVLAVIEKNPDLPYKGVGARFGISPQWVSIIATQAGIRSQTRGPHPAKRRRIEVDHARIAEELANGTSIKAIAKSVGCSFQYVYRLREALAL